MADPKEPTHIVDFSPDDVRAMIFFALVQKGIEIPFGQGMVYDMEIVVSENGNMRVAVTFKRGKPRLRVVRDRSENGEAG